MRNYFRITFLAALMLLLGGCSDKPETATAVLQDDTGAAPVAAESPANPLPDDVIAQVGDEAITFGMLNTMLNSSAVVGLSIPALGTPERQQAILTLLDKVISANLLYLDARQQGVDQLPEYRQDVAKFDDAVLASLYRSEKLLPDIEVSGEEVEAFYASSVDKSAELTDDVRTAIEAKLRDQKLQSLDTRARIREGVQVEINAAVLDPDADTGRQDGDVVATIDTDTITWGEIKTRMRGADAHAGRAEFYLDAGTERRKALDQFIDGRILAAKGRTAGLEQNSSFRERTREFHKTRLINLHRSRLIASWQPSETELKEYFIAHREQITVPERRKVQMVVLATKAEAEAVKKKIDAGELTMFQAAMDYSIDPNAKQTLGEMGWVTRGTGFKELDDFTFFQDPEVVGGPVESPAGWHLVKVLDVQDAQYQYFEEPEARRKAQRMYMREKMDAYVIELRKNRFVVSVDDDALARHFQEEAEYIAGLQEKAAEEGSVTQQRQEELQKWIQPGP